MYDPLYKEGIIAYIELYLLIMIFIYCFYKKRKFLIKNYANKVSRLLKITVFVLVNIFNTIILAFLDYSNVNWVIGVAYNALSISLTIVLAFLICKIEE